MKNLEIKLIKLDLLRPHEEIQEEREENLRDDLFKSGRLLSPLWVENKNLIVLNGHHRLKALEKLGCIFAPCLLMDYESEDIQVKICPGASVSSMDKESVLAAGLSGNLFPPRSSLHTLGFIPPEFPVPISGLRDADGFCSYFPKLKFVPSNAKQRSQM